MSRREWVPGGPPFGFVAAVLVGFFGPMAVVPETTWWPWTLAVGLGGSLVAGLVYRWARRRYG